jgi:hypothetical protein
MWQSQISPYAMSIECCRRTTSTKTWGHVTNETLMFRIPIPLWCLQPAFPLTGLHHHHHHHHLQARALSLGSVNQQPRFQRLSQTTQHVPELSASYASLGLQALPSSHLSHPQYIYTFTNKIKDKLKSLLLVRLAVYQLLPQDKAQQQVPTKELLNVDWH